MIETYKSEIMPKQLKIWTRKPKLK